METWKTKTKDIRKEDSGTGNGENHKRTLNMGLSEMTCVSLNDGSCLLLDCVSCKDLSFIQCCQSCKM